MTFKGDREDIEAALAGRRGNCCVTIKEQGSWGRDAGNKRKALLVMVVAIVVAACVGLLIGMSIGGAQT